MRLILILASILIVIITMACGGAREVPELERWTLAIYQSDTPDISVPVLSAYESVDSSQVDTYGNWVLPKRVESGKKPNHIPTFLQIRDGAFVLHRLVGPDWSPPTEEELVKGKTSVCKVSDEVFGGLTTTFILYRFKSPFTHQDLAQIALSGAKDDIWRETTCGEGVVKKSGMKPNSIDSSSKAESPKSEESAPTPLWTRETLYAQFLVPDDFPSGWTVLREQEALTIRGTHTEFMTAKKIDMDFEVHDTPMAARQSFDQHKAVAQSIVDSRGISGDKLEDIKHDEPMFVWMLKGDKNYGSDEYEALGVTGNVVFKVYNYGSLRAPDKKFTTKLAKKQMDKLTD